MATLYRPLAATGSLPCVVMGAAGTLTQRDGIPDYAERFAAASLAALSFDYRHWGESQGEPRRLVSIPRQLADWRAAIACARELDGIDPERIALWGMSFGGGHAVVTASNDPEVAAVIALVPMADGLAFSRGPHFLRLSARAVVRRLARSERPLPAAGAAGAFRPEDLPNLERLAGANGWRNELIADLGYPMSRYRPMRRAGRVKVPMLVQLGERDRLVPRRAIEKTARRAPRGELRRYPIDHFDCFWPEHIERVAGDQVDFLRRHRI